MPQEYMKPILTDLKTSALMYGYTEANAIYLDATFLQVVNMTREEIGN